MNDFNSEFRVLTLLTLTYEISKLTEAPQNKECVMMNETGNGLSHRDF